MKGFPLLNALLVALALAAGLPFILRLTAKNHNIVPVPQPAGITAQAAMQIPCQIELSFAHPVSSVVVTKEKGELPVYSFRAARPEIVTGRSAFPLENGSCDLNLNVVWQEGCPRTAVTITLRPDGLKEQQLTFWGQDRLEEIASFHWKEGTR